MKELKINHLACLTAILIILAFLYIWYNYIFYEAWLKSNNMLASEFESKKTIFPYMISFISTTLIVYILAWLFRQIKVEDIRSGIIMAMSIGFAFTFLNVLGKDLYLFRPMDISLIDGGANLIACMIAGGILGGWRKEGPMDGEF